RIKVQERIRLPVPQTPTLPWRAGVSHMEFSSPIRGLRLRTAVAPDGSDRIGSRTKQNRNANDGFQARTPLRAKGSRALVRFPYASPVPWRGRVARRALARRAGWGEPHASRLRFTPPRRAEEARRPSPSRAGESHMALNVLHGRKIWILKTTPES